MVKNATDVVVASSVESKDGTNYNADDAKEMELTDEASAESLVYKSLHAVKSFTMPKSMSPLAKAVFLAGYVRGKEGYGLHLYGFYSRYNQCQIINSSTCQPVISSTSQLVILSTCQLVNLST